MGTPVGAGQNAALQFDGASLDRAVLGLHHPLPGELVGARRAGVPPRAAQELSCDVVARRRAFALEFAEHLVATLVRPDAAAHESRLAIDERDHLGAESYAGALRAREQHRPAQVEDRGTPLRAEGDGPTTTCGIPRALEFQPFAGCSVRLRRLRRRSAGGHRKGQNKEGVTSRHAATGLSIVPPCPCEKDHGR